MNTYILKNDTITLVLRLEKELILEATSSLKDKISTDFCKVITNMDISNAAYYGSKITLENNEKNKKAISFVHNNDLLYSYDKLLKKFFFNSEYTESFRFESVELGIWNEKTDLIKKELLNQYLNEYFKENELYENNQTIVNIRNNMFELDLSKFIEKKEYQNTLVNVEVFLRKKLNNIPIILIIQEIKDANKKRK
jgi:hypothetical protein